MDDSNRSGRSTPTRPRPRWLPHWLLLVSSFLPVTVRAQTTLTDKDIERLETLSELGREACQDGKYDSCHRIFVEAQALLPWAPHQFYIAEALVGMGRMHEGLELWRQILRENEQSEDPVTRRFVEQTKRRLAEEEPNLPRLRLTLAKEHTGAIQIVLDGEAADVDTLTSGVSLDPGRHVLEFSQSGYGDERHTLELGRGRDEVLSVELTKLAPASGAPAGSHRVGRDSPPLASTDNDWKMPVGVTLLAVGGVSAMGGGVTFLLKEQRIDDLEEDCNHQDPCEGELSPAEFDAREARIEDRTLVSNVLFFGGVGVAAAGATLMLLDLADDTETAGQDALAVRAAIARDGAWMGWHGTF